MANRSHICIVADDDCLERFGPAVRHLCVGLIDEAIRTTVVGPESRGMQALEIGPIRLETHGRMTWWRRNRALADLVGRLAEDPPHVIHAMSGDLAWLAGHLAHALDLPLVVTLTGTDELNEHTDEILRSAVSVVAVSEPVRTQAIQRLERSDEDVVCIRWGLVAEDEPSCFLDERKDVTLVTMAPLIARAGLEDLIDAMAELARGSRPVMLFVLGSGPAEGQLRQRVAELRLNPWVTFVGPVREWPSVLQGADVFVLPCPQHKLTIHPLAAMAAGLAVVACARGDHDCLVDGQTARTYEPSGVELLTAVLAEVLNDPAGARAMAASSQRYVAQNHRVSAMVAQTVQIYRRLTLHQETIPMPPAHNGEPDGD